MIDCGYDNAGYSIVGVEHLSGYDRSTTTVENEAEIHAAFDDAPQPVLTCAYCGRKGDRTQSREKAIRWFHGHDCNTSAAALWDAGAVASHPANPFLATRGNTELTGAARSPQNWSTWGDAA